MFMKCIPPYTPLLYSKAGVCRGIPIFLIFTPKHIKNISGFVFATRIVQFLFYLNPKFQASSSFLCMYRSVCVGPVRKPHYWFFHKAAHLMQHLKWLDCFLSHLLIAGCDIGVQISVRPSVRPSVCSFVRSSVNIYVEV